MPRRPPDKPRRPTNAFILWLKDNKERLKREHPEMRRFNQLTPIAAQEWSRLTADQKQRYIRAAEAEKERYHTAMELYNRQRGAQQPTMRPAILPLPQDSNSKTAVPFANDHSARQLPDLLCLRCGTAPTPTCDIHTLYELRPKKEPQVRKPMLPLFEVTITAPVPQQPDLSKSGEDEKSTASTAKADNERREVIPPVVSVPPDAEGEEQPKDHPTVELPNNEQTQPVPQQPGDSQHAGPKEWGESVYLQPTK